MTHHPSHLSKLKAHLSPDQQVAAGQPFAKLLIVRFSSFGDIVQALSVPQAFSAKFPGAQVDWLVREDFKTLLQAHPRIRKIHSFDRKSGLTGLICLAWKLAGEDFTHLYDAHCNFRSRIIKSIFTYAVYVSCAVCANCGCQFKQQQDQNQD